MLRRGLDPKLADRLVFMIFVITSSNYKLPKAYVSLKNEPEGIQICVWVCLLLGDVGLARLSPVSTRRMVWGVTLVGSGYHNQAP